MKKRTGSAMVLVLLLAANISLVLVRIYYRCALLQQTVADREKQLIWYNGAQACMQYAIHIAKANWDYITQQSQEQRFDVSWALGKKKLVPAIISFRPDQKTIYITVQLFDNAKIQNQVSCSIKRAQQGKADKVIISDWCDN